MKANCITTCFANDYRIIGCTKTKVPKYMSMVRHVALNKDKSFKRAELFLHYNGNNNLMAYRRASESSGWMSYLTRALNYYGVITYNLQTKLWSAGPNIDKILNSYVEPEC